MRTAFVVYDGMTSLDFIGVYDPLTRLKTMGFTGDLSWEICSFKGDVTDGAGLCMRPNKIGGSLGDYDIVVVPGGFGSRELLRDDKFVEWLSTASGCKFKASVCTGSVLLGAFGFLKGRRATMHRTRSRFQPGRQLSLKRVSLAIKSYASAEQEMVDIFCKTRKCGDFESFSPVALVDLGFERVLAEEIRRPGYH
jgi:hypothetical protein